MPDAFVIIGSDGTKHSFPPGMDPKKAAEIVRQQEAPKIMVNGQPVSIDDYNQTQQSPLQPIDPNEPDTFAGGFSKSLHQTVRDTEQGIGRGITKTLDPRVIMQAVADWSHQTPDQQLQAAQNRPAAVTPASVAQFVQSLPDPKAGGEAIGQLGTALVLNRVVPPAAEAVSQGVQSAGSTASDIAQFVKTRPGAAAKALATGVIRHLPGGKWVLGAGQALDDLYQLSQSAPEAATTVPAATVEAAPAASPRLVKGGGSGTLEAGLNQGLQEAMAESSAAPTRVTAPVPPGATMTPGGMPSVRPDFSYPQSSGPAAAAPSPMAPAAPPVSVAAPPVQTPPPAAAAPMAAAPEVAAAAPAPTGTVWSPQRLRNEIGLAAKRINVPITPEQEAAAAQMIQAGRPPVSAVQAVTAAPAAAAAVAPIPLGKMTDIEQEAFHIGKGGGLSDEEVQGVIQAAREAAAQKMSHMVGSRQAARNLGMTQDEVIALRGPSPAGMPPARLRAILDAGLEARKDDPAALAKYVADAADKPPAVMAYLKKQLGLP